MTTPPPSHHISAKRVRFLKPIQKTGGPLGRYLGNCGGGWVTVCESFGTDRHDRLPDEHDRDPLRRLGALGDG